MKKQICLIFLGFVPAVIFAQSSNFLKRLQIRQSFESDDAKENPAVFSLTFPKDTNSSYLIDIGVSYRLSDNAKQSYGAIVAEYHRTNLIDEEVNNLQVGYKHKWTFKKPNLEASTWEGILNNLNNPFGSFVLNTSAKFRRDKIEGSAGVVGTFLFSYFKLGAPNKTSLGAWNIQQQKPGKVLKTNNKFAWLLIPEAGIEFQHNFKADSTLFKGFVGRTVGKINLSFGTTKTNPKSQYVPLFKWLFTADIAMRYDLIGEQYTDSRFHPMIQTGLDIYLVNDKPLNLVLGAAFTYGDNPVEGFREFKFEPQNMWVIALKVKK